MYGVLEHLLPLERVILLRRLGEQMKAGDILVTYETPNRLHPVNWHGPRWLFPWILPAELTYLYLKADQICPAEELIYELPSSAAEKMYRDGVGASFHEFCLAFDLSDFEILADGDSSVDRTPNPDYRSALRRTLGEYKNPIPAGFSCPSLDFVFAKK